MIRGIRSSAICFGAAFVAAIVFAACHGAPLDPSAKKVEICHIPPGNPDNAHTITVSENAVPAHLAHGDRMDACDAAEFGACCDATGCTDAAELDCDAVGGSFKGGGTSCSDVPDPCSIMGACCAGARCGELTEFDCGDRGGNYAGDDTTCADVPDPCSVPPTGACCDGTTCSEETERACNASGFDYKGDGTSCADVPAPCEAAPPTGACCDGATCSEEPEIACNRRGFDYKGDGTSCSDVPAPCAPPVPTGACCAESGCSDETQVDCDGGGGAYRGDNTSCRDADVCVDTICHIPPGNPSNRKTMEINAWETSGHLGHGDTLGACP